MLSFQRRHIFQVDSKCFPCSSPAAAPSLPTAMSRGTLPAGVGVQQTQVCEPGGCSANRPQKRERCFKKIKNVILKERDRSVVINQDS